MSTDRNPDYDYRMITVNDVAALSQQIIAEVERAIVGKTEVLRMILAACLSTGGHVLLEDYLAKEDADRQQLRNRPGSGRSGASSSHLTCSPATSPVVMSMTEQAARPVAQRATVCQHHPGRRDQQSLAQDAICPA